MPDLSTIPDGAGPVGIVLVTLIGVLFNAYTSNRGRKWAQIDAKEALALAETIRLRDREEDERKRAARAEELKLEIELRAATFNQTIETARQAAQLAYTKADDTNQKLVATNEHIVDSNKQIATLTARFAQLLEREGVDRREALTQRLVEQRDQKIERADVARHVADVAAGQVQAVADRATVAGLAASDRADRADVAALAAGDRADRADVAGLAASDRQDRADVAALGAADRRDRADVAGLAAEDRADRANVARRVEEVAEGMRDTQTGQERQLRVSKDTNARVQEIVPDRAAEDPTVGEQIAETHDAVVPPPVRREGRDGDATG